MTFREGVAGRARQAGEGQRDTWTTSPSSPAASASTRCSRSSPWAAGRLPRAGHGQRLGRGVRPLETLLPLSTKEGMYGAIAQLTAAGPILAQVARFAGQGVVDEYRQQLLRGEITVDEITSGTARRSTRTSPTSRNTDVIVRGIDGSLRQVKSVGDAIRGLPSEKQIGSPSSTAPANARGTTVTRNPTAPSRPAPTPAAARSSLPAGRGRPRRPDRRPRPGVAVRRGVRGQRRLHRQAPRPRGGHQPRRPARPAVRRAVRSGRATSTCPCPPPAGVKDSVTSEIESIATAARAAAAAAQARADADSSVGGQGTAASGGQGSGWQWQIATLRRRSWPGPELRLFRPGSRTVSGNNQLPRPRPRRRVPPAWTSSTGCSRTTETAPRSSYPPRRTADQERPPHMYTGAVGPCTSTTCTGPSTRVAWRAAWG